MLDAAERCQPNHLQCSKFHAATVWDYHRERERQESALEEAGLGYETEMNEIAKESPLITFKDWLINNPNRTTNE